MTFGEIIRKKNNSMADFSRDTSRFVVAPYGVEGKNNTRNPI